MLCAGILSTRPEWTREGLERTFVPNYLGRFLLAQRLARLLKSAPSGRLVLVSNAGKYPDTLDFDDLQHRCGKPGLAVSGRTQFANDLLAVELTERLRGSALRVSCVFPGVTRSSCFRNARGLPWFMRWLAPIVVRLVGRSPAAAAITPVFLAHDPAAAIGDALFFGPDRLPMVVPARARHRERRELLWSASNALVRPYVERDDADLSQP